MAMQLAEEVAVLLRGVDVFGLAGGRDLAGLNEGFDSFFDSIDFGCVVNS